MDLNIRFTTIVPTVFLEILGEQEVSLLVNVTSQPHSGVSIARKQPVITCIVSAITPLHVGHASNNLVYDGWGARLSSTVACAGQEEPREQDMIGFGFGHQQGRVLRCTQMIDTDISSLGKGCHWSVTGCHRVAEEGGGVTMHNIFMDHHTHHVTPAPNSLFKEKMRNISVSLRKTVHPDTSDRRVSGMLRMTGGAGGGIDPTTARFEARGGLPFYHSPPPQLSFQEKPSGTQESLMFYSHAISG
ncbi:hypothetical protein RRG08_015522 [Elysia crispata]|uniref:Uncharacterized protein n=1 Tax=Elysia crispata TaxID=231223 RepID=A0AAE0YJ12_9GAST|nr:hypothetical protein RRG08_015522 [Elysia crispata]